jgi:hypothetical protein
VRAAGGTAGAETDGGVAIGAAVFGGAAGVTTREGALVAAALETGAAGRTAGAAGFASCAGGAGREEGALGAVPVPCCLARIAFSTSPGLDMWERSILGLMPSASGRAARADLAL